MFKVIGTDTYSKEISKLPKDEAEAAEKIPKHLAENPFAGKPFEYRLHEATAHLRSSSPPTVHYELNIRK